MSSREWIIPLPEDYLHKGRRAVGLIPCHGHDCDEYILVRLDVRGRPYAPCDGTITGRGCKPKNPNGGARRYDLIVSDLPPQTRQHALSMIDDFQHMPTETRELLISAWQFSETEIQGCSDAVEQAGTETEIDTEIQAETPDGETGNPTETAENPDGETGDDTGNPAGDPDGDTADPGDGGGGADTLNPDGGAIGVLGI